MPHLRITLIRSELDSHDGGNAVLPLAVKPRQLLGILAVHHPPYRVGAYTFLGSDLAEQIRDISALDIGGPRPPAPVSRSFRRVVSGPFISCIPHHQSSTAMQTNASRSLHCGTLHKPICNLKHTTITLHSFSKAEAQNDGSEDPQNDDLHELRAYVQLATKARD
jgi:hypothetical protein